MNRVHAILSGLLLAAWAPYSHAGALAPAAAQPGFTVEGEAITPDSPAVAGADSEAPAPEGSESIGQQSPMGTGNMPESVEPPGKSVEPPDNSGGSDSPSDSSPGSSY